MFLVLFQSKMKQIVSQHRATMSKATHTFSPPPPLCQVHTQFSPITVNKACFDIKNKLAATSLWDMITGLIVIVKNQYGAKVPTVEEETSSCTNQQNQQKPRTNRSNEVFLLTL